MPIQTIANSDLQYYLICYNKHGVERSDDPDGTQGRLSDTIHEILRNGPVTDVFLLSHGWKGDIPAAKEQYDNWISAAARCEADLDALRNRNHGFSPLLIGLHWPSLPWGVETHVEASVAFEMSSHTKVDELIEGAAEKIADSDPARTALKVIFDAAADDLSPSQLPNAVVDAYRILQKEAGLVSDGPGAAPGDDAEDFDPQQAYEASRALEGDVTSFGSFSIGGLLSPLRQLSFWTMKKRARRFGERGAGALLRSLQRVSSDQGAQFHLMGHSFGCIVVSAAVAGNDGNEPLERPVGTLYLVQGALSLWAYCSDIPVQSGTPGYFYSIARDDKVSGPIIVTQSEFDTAVGKLYPLGAGVAGQVVYAPGELPKYGAIGTFGAHGAGIRIEQGQILSVGAAYNFRPGHFYNLDCSTVISEGEGLSGAHSDIAKSEVGHAFWAGVLCSH